MPPFDSISLPLIDVSCLLGHDSNVPPNELMRTTSNAILDALAQFGAFQCITSTRNNFNIFDTAELLLHTSKKDGIGAVKRGGFVRGYIGMGAYKKYQQDPFEILIKNALLFSIIKGHESGGAALEVKEGFSYGGSEASASLNKLTGENIFPPSLSASEKEKAQDYYDRCCAIARAISQGLAIALPSNPLLQQFSSENDALLAKAISLLRVFKYFPYSAANSDNPSTAIPHVDRLGSTPHTDWGYLTLIQSNEAGLQIASTPTVTPETVWRTVEPVADAFIVNGGDYLSVLTHGRILSPLHRVVNLDNSFRTSMVFFYYPPYDTKVPAEFDLELLNETGESSNAVERLKHLSLFQDQRSDKSKGRKLDLKTVCFGDYISSKWESVSRDY
ncbi:hypothetical protein HDU81_011095 [Chytriomyces hyalinus]|nr:hypothetical protein HDU81_011095 [Chytriomyces hyalinus]